jgi:hypothetical protein
MLSSFDTRGDPRATIASHSERFSESSFKVCSEDASVKVVSQREGAMTLG